MDTTITFTVNGKPRTVTTDPQRPLLDILRENLGLTGTKYGCGEGMCRACTVLVNGRGVASCITPVDSVNRQKITTIEGLASADKLHPVQEAFLDVAPYQCGYCTAGMIMGTVGLLNDHPHPTDDQILSHMQRHLCRCCSYAKYLEAVHRAVAQSGKASE